MNPVRLPATTGSARLEYRQYSSQRIARGGQQGDTPPNELPIRGPEPQVESLRARALGLSPRGHVSERRRRRLRWVSPQPNGGAGIVTTRRVRLRTLHTTFLRRCHSGGAFALHCVQASGWQPCCVTWEARAPRGPSPRRCRGTAGGAPTTHSAGAAAGRSLPRPAR